MRTVVDELSKQLRWTRPNQRAGINDSQHYFSLVCHKSLEISHIHSFLLLKGDHRSMSLFNEKKVANIICNSENYYFLINLTL